MRVAKIWGVFYALTLFCSTLIAQNLIINDDKILSQKVVDRLNLIATELYTKSGINVHVAVFESLNGMSMQEKLQSLNLTSPFAILMLVKNDKKVEIYADDETFKLFDRNKILSPFPESGTILPILASKNGKDIYNAAMINGYADLSEQIANSKNIVLENAIGNANKDTLNVFRILVYGSMIFVIIAMIYKRKRAKNG